MRKLIRRNYQLISVTLLAAILVVLTVVIPQSIKPSLTASSFEIAGTNLSGNLIFDIAKGNVEGHTIEHKFGQHIDVDTIPTDIWDLSTQKIWVVPTESRYHVIVSTDVDDSGLLPSGGARTLEVSGLIDWDTKERSETLILDGTSPVTTTIPFACIHRLEVLTKGSVDVNIGTITATAIGDNTITAQINPGAGQTQMAIYCLPSVQTAYVGVFVPTLSDALGQSEVLIEFLYNPEPDVELLNFVSKSRITLRADGDSGLPIRFWVPRRFPGPGIMKVQATGTANNLAVSAMFDMILVDN